MNESEAVLVKVILDERLFEKYVFDPSDLERMAEIQALVGKHIIIYVSELMELIDKISDVCYNEYRIDYSLNKNCISIYLFQD